MNDIKFGTGGWRAIIGDGFTKANVQRLTRALAWKMQDEGVAQRGFLIGYDRRFLSREAAHWAAEVLAGADVPCMVVEREAPTPLIMFAVRYYDLPYGMAVTASHNPALYNGVKVFTRGGRDADENVTASVESYISALPDSPCPAVPYEEGVRTGKRLSELYGEITSRYGSFEMVERGYRFSQEEKEHIHRILMEDRQLPDFGLELEKVSYADGCKVYFQNGGWVVARFSGTEPLLRVFSEMGTAEQAARVAEQMGSFLGLSAQNLE